MRKALALGPILAVILALSFAGPLPAQAAPAQVNPGKQIGVTEVTGAGSWPELPAVVEAIRTNYGVPIHADGCVQGQPCVYVWHFTSRTGPAGLAGPRPGEPGSTNVGFNHAFDRGSTYRQMVIFHELGHALGLREHDSTCRSSMMPSLGSCGRYVLGYSPDQQAILQQIWG